MAGHGAWMSAWGRLTGSVQRRVVHELRTSLECGERRRIAALLAPDIAVVVDGGDDARPVLRMVRGADDAIALLLHGVAPDGLVLAEREVNGQAGLVLRRGDGMEAAMAVDIEDGLVRLVWVRLHPAPVLHGLAV